MTIDCDCSVTSDFYGPRCTSDRLRMAHKEHQCCECHEPIKIGQKYEHAKGIDRM
jgi:hypothetical protein